MISIWEKESLLSYDVVIIGAGITGLSTAASLKEKQPGLSILVIEKGTLPHGASTRNAGFACFGSTSELQEDIRQLGETGMCHLVEKRWKGLEKTRNRLGETNIGFVQSGGYELYRDMDYFNPDEIAHTNQLLKEVVGDQVFVSQNERIQEFGFRQVNHLVYNKYEGVLHIGKMMSSLWDYCQKSGVRVITGSDVLDVQSGQGKAIVFTKDHMFEAKAVGICTNAFSKKLVADLNLRPGRGMTMLISPERAPSFEGAFHYEKGYYYFRNFGDQIIFGGGRNMDLETESTLEFGINQKIREKLLMDLDEMIIHGQPYEIEMEWSGIMAFGQSKAPVIKQLDAHIFAGVRLGGMGVAIGSMVGEELAEMMLCTDF